MYQLRKQPKWWRFKRWLTNAAGWVLLALAVLGIGAVLVLAFAWALAIMSIFTVWFMINQFFGNGCKVTIDGKPAGRLRRFKIEKD